jgi:hypothetical protein
MTQTMNTWAPELVLRQQEIKIQQDGPGREKASEGGNFGSEEKLVLCPQETVGMGDVRYV